MNYCGIDTSFKTLDVVIRKKGKSLKCMTFKNDVTGHMKLIKTLKHHQVERVGLEATGYYHLDIALELSETDGIDLMVINPRAAHNFAKALMVTVKTDAVDAEVIAKFVERMDFTPWCAPDYEVFALRTCGRRLISLTKERSKAKNHLHAFSLTRKTPTFITDDVQLSIEQLDNQIDNMISHALKIIEKNETLAHQYKQLIGISGIADKTAIKLLGELGLLAPDMSAKQWVAHAGLFPRIFQSGTSVNKTPRIGKVGNRYIREALYMAALSACRYDENIKGFYLHLVNDNGLKKIQAVCAVMRKLLMAIHGMFKEDTLFNGSKFYVLENT